MKIQEILLTKGSNHGRTCQTLIPKGITIHYVGNPGSTAISNRNWFENGAGGAHTSAHYIIGLNGEIIRCIPENERAMHAGKSYGSQWNEAVKTNNSRYIGIECCHPDSSGKFNNKTYASLVELVNDICNRYELDKELDIVRHFDITGKSCPIYYVINQAEWKQLLKDIGGFEMITQTTININGTIKTINRILKNDTNFVSLREACELAGLDVKFDAKANPQIIITSKK